MAINKSKSNRNRDPNFSDYLSPSLMPSRYDRSDYTTSDQVIKEFETIFRLVEEILRRTAQNYTRSTLTLKLTADEIKNLLNEATTARITLSELLQSSGKNDASVIRTYELLIKKENDLIAAYGESKKKLQQYEAWFTDLLKDLEAIAKGGTPLDKIKSRALDLLTFGGNTRELNRASKIEELTNEIKLIMSNVEKHQSDWSDEQKQVEANKAKEKQKEINEIKYQSLMESITQRIVSNGFSSVIKGIDTAVEKSMSFFHEQYGAINARLQGSAYDLKSINDTFVNDFSNTGYVSMADLWSNIAKLTSLGISYNLELRALIETLGNRMVTTFSTMDASLTQLVRLLLQDLTFSQLGSEAKLTQLLNSVFLDTSYLDNLYDLVNANLLEAMGSMSPDEATSFGYTVLKWLGSLYSLGMSSGSISNISLSINALATGQVNQLEDNNLIKLAVSRAGLSLGDILTGGLDYNTTNTILKTMVEYLADISQNTGNNVTKAAWANIAGLNLADFLAIKLFQNFPEKLELVTNSNIANYTEAVNEATTLLNLATSDDRLLIYSYYNTLMENVLSDKANAFVTGNDELLMGTYIASNAISLLTNAMGITGIALDVVNAITGVTKLGSVLGSDIGEDNKSFLEKIAEKAINVVAGDKASSFFESIMKVAKMPQSIAIGLGDMFGNISTGVLDRANFTDIGGLSSFYNSLIGENLNQATISNLVGAAGNFVSSLPEQSGISYSRSSEIVPTTRGFKYTNISGIDSNDFYTFGTAQSVDTESIAENYVGVSRSLSDLYYKLFEELTVALRVKISEFEDKAVSDLFTSALFGDAVSKNLSDVRSRIVDGSVNVDIVDNDINSLKNNIYSMRWYD